MKRKLLLIIMILQSIYSFSQSYVFRESFKVGYGVNGPPTVGATSDTGNVMIIFVESSTSSASNFNMTRIDKTGNLIWSKNYGLPAFVWAYNPIELSDHNILASGQTSTGDVLILKTDSAGNKLWAKSVGTVANEYSQRCLEGNSNSYFICCASGNAPDSTHFLLLNLDSTGNVTWAKKFGSNNYDDPISFTRTYDGGFAFIGRTMGFGVAMTDFYLVRLDSLGNVLWSRTFGAGGQEYGRNIVETNDNGLLMIGETGSFGSNWRGLIIKVDSVGNLLWSKTYDNGGYMELDNCMKMPDGNIVISNVSTPSILKIDSIGNILWSYKYIGYFGGFSCLNVNNDIAMVGLDWNPDSLTFYKSDMNGMSCEQSNSTLTITSVSLTIDSPLTISYPIIPIVTNYNLPVVNITPQFQFNCITTSVNEIIEDENPLLVYPNPFTSFISLTIKKQNAKQIRVIIHDIFGKTLLQSEIYNWTSEIDLKFLPSGIYLFEIIIDGERTVKKIVKE
jgi:hypothetical protein